MTIIAVKDGVMAADSFCFSGDLKYPCVSPKIIRAPDGGIAAMAGRNIETQEFRRWVVAGMDFDKPPAFANIEDEDTPLAWLWLAQDGRCYHGIRSMRRYETATPYAVGTPTACAFAEGAMRAGLSAERAVALAIEHCELIGGTVQVERLSAIELAA